MSLTQNIDEIKIKEPSEVSSIADRIDYYAFGLKCAQAVMSIIVAILLFAENNRESSASVETAYTCMILLTILRIPKHPKYNIHIILNIYCNVLAIGLYGVLSILDFADLIKRRRFGIVVITRSILTFLLTGVYTADLVITEFFDKKPLLPPPIYYSVSEEKSLPLPTTT